MGDTEERMKALAAKETRRLEQREQTLHDIARGIPVRAVIWFLLVVLIGTTGFIGRSMIGRLDALEIWKREQNGHLRDLSRDTDKIKTDVEWIKKALERR